MFERPAPFDVEKGLLLVATGEVDQRLAHAINLLAYFRDLAEAGTFVKLCGAVITLTEVPRGA